MGKKTILVADDSKPILDMFGIWLKGIYEVIVAVHGREAVEKYKEARPDLVLMDIRMPVMSGDEAIKEILEFDPDANIVAVTAYDYKEEDLGVPVMRKGFAKDEFMKNVERLIEGIKIVPL